jgi:NADH dehydrogenase
MSRPQVVIVGAGFGGLEVAKRLKKADCDVLIIDRLNHHLFQPLLYQVATAALSPGDIAVPIRDLVSKNKNTSILMGQVVRVDKENRTITLEDGTSFSFDFLVLAPGARHSYFGRNEWEQFAPGIKTIDDALHVREKILTAFERAERAPTYEEGQKMLRFAIVGGGPTGCELAGDIAAIAFKNLVAKYKHVESDEAQIFLIEGMDRILPGFPESLSKKAEKMLQDLGVHILLNKKVTDITPDGVMMGDEFLPAPNVIWAAGNQASPLLQTLGIPLDRQGRVQVEKDLSIPNHDNIFVIGDAANCADSQGKPLPALAPVAKQQGRLVARIIANNIPKPKRPAFSYTDKGSLAVIGKGKAIGMIGKVELSGFSAWFIWTAVHILYLIGFRNRVLVLTQWLFWYYLGKLKNALITKPLRFFTH